MSVKEHLFYGLQEHRSYDFVYSEEDDDERMKYSMHFVTREEMKKFIAAKEELTREYLAIHETRTNDEVACDKAKNQPLIEWIERALTFVRAFGKSRTPHSIRGYLEECVNLDYMDDYIDFPPGMLLDLPAASEEERREAGMSQCIGCKAYRFERDLLQCPSCREAKFCSMPCVADAIKNGYSCKRIFPYYDRDEDVHYFLGGVCDPFDTEERYKMDREEDVTF